MKAKLYSYRDALVGFGPILVESNERTAIRGFSYAVNNAQGIMNFSPKDYDLFYIGEFDTDTGVISPAPVCQLVVNGSSVFTEEKV